MSWLIGPFLFLFLVNVCTTQRTPLTTSPLLSLPIFLHLPLCPPADEVWFIVHFLWPMTELTQGPKAVPPMLQQDRAQFRAYEQLTRLEIISLQV